MVNTTKDGETPVVLPQTDNERIIELYVQGKNLYDITYAVYKFGGDEAVENVRSVLHSAGYLDKTHVTPDTFLVED